MSNNIKRILPNAMSAKSKVYEVKLSAPVLLKSGAMGVSCYLPDDAPAGRYWVYSPVVKSVLNSYKIVTKPIFITARQNDFMLMLENTEGMNYSGSLYFNINEVVAEAISF